MRVAGMTSAKERPPRPCPTLHKLANLQPGQRLVYYIGHLPHDILMSESSARQCQPALLYAALLRELTGEVYRMASKKLVTLEVEDLVRTITRVRPSDAELIRIVVPVKQYSVVGK